MGYKESAGSIDPAMGQVKGLREGTTKDYIVDVREKGTNRISNCAEQSENHGQSMYNSTDDERGEKNIQNKNRDNFSTKSIQFMISLHS